MVGESSEKGFEGEKEVTPESVEKFFRFKAALRTARNEEAVLDVCKNAGIEILPEEIEAKRAPALRKQLLNRYLSLHFSTSSSEEEQREKLEQNIQKLVALLTQENARSIVWIGGSYATGKAHSAYSDLDLFVGLPHGGNEREIELELKALHKMDSIDFIMSENIAPFSDLGLALKTGRGLVRLSGMTKDGVEVDFHGIGMDDVRSMDKLSPGFVERIRKTKSYREDRTSFTGNRNVLPKSGSELFHHKKVRGQMFKGFYPDNFSALGELVYDPTGEGEEIQDALWLAIVKGFLFHSEAYQKNLDGKTVSIDRDIASFPSFLKTLFYQFPEDYSETKLSSLEKHFHETLEEIAKKYNLTLL